MPILSEIEKARTISGRTNKANEAETKYHNINRTRANINV